MPSPFPGMDPFLESQLWSDFHHEFISGLREHLVGQLRPKYVAEVQKRVYVERMPDEAAPAPAAGGSGLAPHVMSVPMPVEVRQAFLVLRSATSQEIVTVMEVLSPGNKRSGHIGRRKYLKKRDQTLGSNTHLVEIDLLRGGLRVPLRGELPPYDYLAVVLRSDKLPQAEVFTWSLRDLLPKIPIPLLPGDSDARCDLGEVFRSVYDRAGYDYMLHYEQPLDPLLAEADKDWLRGRLESIRKT